MHLSRVFAPLVACLTACTDRPLQTTDDLPDTTTATTTDTPSTTGTPTTGTAPGTTSGTSGTTFPGTTTSGTSDTSGAGTTSSTGDTSGTTAPVETTDTTSGTTGDGPPSTCGPPCDATWEHIGNLNIDAAGDFSCLTRVYGDLSISSQSSPDVVATLANLRRVDKQLRISDQATLTDLSTFACLEDTGQITLTDMLQLTDLSALAGLRSAQVVFFQKLGITALPAFAPEFEGIRQLALRDNPNLTDLSAASSWGIHGEPLQVLLESNTALPTTAGLAGLVAANDQNHLFLQIVDAPALVSLAGLESVTAATLYFDSLPALPDLAPLKNLTIGGSIVLLDIPQVPDLTGLSGLTTADELTIGDCVGMTAAGMASITSLAGLDSLTSLGSLALATNANLESLAGAPKLTDIAISVNVVDNPKLTQNAHDTFIAQLDPKPFDCFGGWDLCQCFIVMPW